MPGRAIGDELLAAWRDLVSRAAEPNPFAEPETVLPAVRHLAGRSRVGVLTSWRGNRLDGLLLVQWPVMVPAVAGRRLPVPLLQAWVEPYQVLSTPLLDGEDPVGAMAGLLRPPGRLPAPALLLRYFAEDGPVAAALDAALARRGQEAVRLKTYERAWLPRELPDPSRNRKNRYKRLRRQREALAAALGPVRVRDRADDPDAIEEFLALEAAGWKGRSGTALACQPAHAAWFREACDGLRDAGRLEVLTVEAGDRTTAMAVDFAAGDGSLHFKSAYDETLGEHRPGEQILLHAVDTAADGRYAWRDSATVPDNTLFNQLWPGRRRFSTVLVPLSGAAGSVTLAAARRVQQLRDRGTG
ncbi:GNAT family N-acetyltransferase [Blastococcus sp. SYSU DS0617]